MNCSQCNSAISLDAKFCPQCGAAFTGSGAPAADPPIDLEPPRKKYTAWLVLLGVAMIGVLSADLIPLFTGHPEELQKNASGDGLGTILWTSLFCWLLWKHRGLKGKRGAWTGAGLGLLAWILFSGIGGFMQGAARSEHENLQKEVADFAGGINANLDKYSNPQVHLDSATATNDLTLELKATTLQYSAKDVDMEKFRRAIPLMAEKLCNDQNMRPEIDKGMNVRYAYYGNDGAHIGDIEVTRAACTKYPMH